jgi:methylphosphotriester-DNA--protein-cysteine methyltransferase
MIYHLQMSDRELRNKIRRGIYFAGHQKLKTYGTLRCKSGKRMLPKNRVFFTSIDQAVDQGFRPCGHCLPLDYKKWKHGFV